MCQKLPFFFFPLSSIAKPWPTLPQVATPLTNRHYRIGTPSAHENGTHTLAYFFFFFTFFIFFFINLLHSPESRVNNPQRRVNSLFRPLRTFISQWVLCTAQMVIFFLHFKPFSVDFQVTTLLSDESIKTI